ncbi:MAG: 4Fe-4S binding protein [bacterium]
MRIYTRPVSKNAPVNPARTIQKIRLIVQSAFALLCIWIGVEFYFFIKYLETNGQSAFVNRPPGVEGFLPISSLMSLYQLFLTGTIHPYHPAGLFILSAIILLSLVFGKAFCSWLCPVGFISEALGDLGEKIFGRKIRTPNWLDYPLRSLKYLLLLFFVYSIFFLMSKAALEEFLSSPYNLLSDVKMYYFFADISRFSLIVLSILFLLSIPIRNFWCRYFCPYGALLGVTSLISPNKIQRNEDFCIKCSRCAKVCPSFIKVDKIKTVISDECTSCMNCVDSCPVSNTLELKFVPTKRMISTKWVAIAVVGIFMVVTGIAIITGNWQNNIPIEDYIFYQKNIHGYGHPTSTDDIKKLNEETKKN